MTVGRGGERSHEQRRRTFPDSPGLVNAQFGGIPLITGLGGNHFGGNSQRVPPALDALEQDFSGNCVRSRFLVDS
jgi:hypothetical protein